MNRMILLSWVSLLLSAVSSVADDAFVGEWINVDDKTNNLTRIEIAKTGEDLTIRAWGAARGGEIDQGTVKMNLLADSAGSTEMKFGYASFDHKFVESHVTFRLDKPWLMSVEDFNIFKDNSGRSNYRMRGDFKKVIKAPERD
jgi:hypothetical protein